MKRNFTSTLVMLGLLVGLSAWYFFYEQQYRSKQKQAEDTGKKLLSLTADDINEIRLDKLKNPPTEGSTTPVPNPVYESIELKRTGKDWTILSPVQTSGDSIAINSLLTAACDAKQERVVEENPKDLSAYGLQTPLIKIALKKDANTPTQEIDIGNDTPVAYSIYAKTATSPQVFKSSRTLRSSLDKDLFALRDKNVLKISRDDLTEVEIESTKGSVLLQKESGSNRDGWILSRENLPADALEWTKTLTPLIELKATKIAAEKDAVLAPYGLNKPLAKITFTLKDKTRAVLLLGKVNDSLFAKRNGLETIFEVDKTLEGKVLMPASQYRDRHLAKFDRYSVSKIKIEKSGEQLELNKTENETWNFPSETTLVVDAAQVDRLLTKLQDTQITNYLEGKPQGSLSKPALKIALFENKNKNEKEVINLSFSSLTGNKILGVRSDIPFRFEISKDDFDKLNISKQSLLKHEEQPKEINKGNKKS